MSQEVTVLTEKNEILNKELDEAKDKEKQQRVSSMQTKNELFMAQKNAEIQIDALKSQLSLKEQQFEQN